jgi:cellulose synthase/poly-beta-1,6-N-acetylglucosamine synthase-like glycosyltransferase
MRTAPEIVFWTSAGLIVWTQVGYALLVALLARILAPAPPASLATQERPRPPNLYVSLIVAAHDEQAVITTKVENALALDYPRELFELIVACDGCTDATAKRAREAGADLVLELPRGGKIAAQDAAVERAQGEIVAFSDANALWEPGALRELVSAFADPRVGYACGRVRFFQGPHLPAASASVPSGTQAPAGVQTPAGTQTPAGAQTLSRAQVLAGAQATNQEGLYWRYEMALRARESLLCSITAGNGAIYATRRDSYIVVDPVMGHDLSFPFKMVKRGWRAVDVPGATATEKMVPSIEGEWRRKRRMMSHTWPIVLRGGMLSPRGYTLGYALMILSHRLLRYLTPFLHALAFAANVVLVVVDAGALYTVTLALQLALLVAAALAKAAPVQPLLIARYYVLTTASPAAGLWDWLRHGTAASWEVAEGTR